MLGPYKRGPYRGAPGKVDGPGWAHRALVRCVRAPRAQGLLNRGLIRPYKAL